MDQMLAGAIAAASALVALFFFRFWVQSRDRFFLLFAGSFALEAVDRVLLVAIPHANEQEPMLYLLRLVAYGLIIAAIWQKNRSR